MITFNISGKQLRDESVQAFAVFCPAGDFSENGVATSLERFYKPLKAIAQERSFNGGKGSQLVVSGEKDGKPVYILLYGLGHVDKLPIEDKIERVRRAVGSLVRTAESFKLSTIALQFPSPELFEVNAYKLAQELVITAMIAEYHFNQYITDESRKCTLDLTISLCVPDSMVDECKVGLEHGQYIGAAVNQARLWSDLPGCIIKPETFAERMQQIAKIHDLGITIFGKKEMEEMQMGGILGVSQGSPLEPKLIIMEYRSSYKDAPTIALVGKGITFDSGGLSIKPAPGMEGMKEDMAGAAAVISALDAISHLKPRVNVIAVAPLAENMVSGTAQRPDDIIQFYNGKTAEVKNTDAEGRLILADALSYMVKNYKLDAIIDLATLTGACVAALGPYYCGLMSNYDDLVAKLQEASKRSGDRVWRLPFHDDYIPAIRSEVADIANIGSSRYKAGTITAGLFLKNFVDDVPWAHLDIAGTASGVPDISYFRPGSTGFGVRLLVDLMTNWPVKES